MPNSQKSLWFKSGAEITCSPRCNDDFWLLGVPVRLLVVLHPGRLSVVQLHGGVLVGVHPAELLLGSRVVCRTVSPICVVRKADPLVTHIIRSCTKQGMATLHLMKDLE